MTQSKPPTQSRVVSTAAVALIEQTRQASESCRPRSYCPLFTSLGNIVPFAPWTFFSTAASVITFASSSTCFDSPTRVHRKLKYQVAFGCPLSLPELSLVDHWSSLCKLLSLLNFNLKCVWTRKLKEQHRNVAENWQWDRGVLLTPRLHYSWIVWGMTHCLAMLAASVHELALPIFFSVILLISFLACSLLSHRTCSEILRSGKAVLTTVFSFCELIKFWT